MHRIYGITSAALVCAALTSGCAYSRTMSETARSGTEQLLVSHSVEQAVAALTLPALSGRKVFVGVEAVPTTDTAYLRGVLEARLGQEGALVVPEAEAELRVVALVGAIGTAARKGSFGLPSIPLPTIGVTPDIPFVSALRQSAWTRVQLAVRDTTGALVARTDAVQAEAYFNLTSVLFVEVRRSNIFPTQSVLGLD